MTVLYDADEASSLLASAEPYQTIIGTAQALVSVLHGSGSPRSLEKLRQSAALVLRDAEISPWAPINMSDLGDYSLPAFKRTMLIWVRDHVVNAFVLPRERTKSEGKFGPTARVRMDDAMAGRAHDISRFLILFAHQNSQRMRSFIARGVHAASVADHIRTLTPKVAYLLANGAATATNLTYAMLVVLGRDSRGKRNFFSADIVAELEDVGATSMPL